MVVLADLIALLFCTVAFHAHCLENLRVYIARSPALNRDFTKPPEKTRALEIE